MTHDNKIVNYTGHQSESRSDEVKESEVSDEKRGRPRIVRGRSLGCLLRLLRKMTMFLILPTKEHTQLSHLSQFSAYFTHCTALDLTTPTIGRSKPLTPTSLVRLVKVSLTVFAHSSFLQPIHPNCLNIGNMFAMVTFYYTYILLHFSTLIE